VDATASSLPRVTYKLAIGDRVKHLGDDRFELVHNNLELIREPEHTPPAV
jgi:hypothetical protein